MHNLVPGRPSCTIIVSDAYLVACTIYYIQITIFNFIYLFISKSAGFLFWCQSSQWLTLCCTLSSLAYFAEMTHFMTNITFLIFSPACILFVEVSTVLTFCSIVVVVAFTLPLPLKACILPPVAPLSSGPVLLKICALLSVVWHPSHMLLYFSRVWSADASWSISSLALCSLTPV